MYKILKVLERDKTGELKLPEDQKKYIKGITAESLGSLKKVNKILRGEGDFLKPLIIKAVKQNNGELFKDLIIKIVNKNKNENFEEVDNITRDKGLAIIELVQSGKLPPDFYKGKSISSEQRPSNIIGLF